jgi:hypothetical protein
MATEARRKQHRRLMFTNPNVLELQEMQHGLIFPLPFGAGSGLSR